MAEPSARILLIGAHPDDVDLKAGGTARKWCALSHAVKLVSLTNGQAGHQSQHGEELAQRRRAEAHCAAAVIGATYEVWNQPDGELDDSLENRRQVIRLLRTFRPDLVVTHRPNDYHPDHRFTALLVQDAFYLVTVPAICPETPHLERNPVLLYFSDNFTKPCRFTPDVVVDIGSEMERLVTMLSCHGSQFFEWLPFNAGYLHEVPTQEVERKSWFDARIRQRIRLLADRYRQAVVATYGAARGSQVEYIEAFEVSEYGAPLDQSARSRLFPFLPAAAGRIHRGLRGVRIRRAA
jgi:LmbE family N-acetylglucosaminyl deacetylase